MNKLRSVLTLVLVAAITGCQKTENVDPVATACTPQSHLQLKNAEDDWRAAANPENPFDEIGLGHNRCLSSILATVPVEGLSDASRVYDAGFEYGASRYDRSQLDRFAEVFTRDQVASVYETLRSGIPEQAYVLELSGVQGDARDYLGRLLAQVYTNDAAELSYDDLKRVIMRWEAGIASERFGDQDRMALYAFGSTLRYSLLAWQGVELPADGQGHVELRNFWHHLFHWVATAVFDAAGAIAGTAIGGPVGGVVGGAALSGGTYAIANSIWP